MYASRYVVFAARPAGPVLSATFESAAAAEHHSETLRVATFIAGPVHPRAESTWAVAPPPRRGATGWLVTHEGVEAALSTTTVFSITLVRLEDVGRLLCRGLLLRTTAFARPLFLREEHEPEGLTALLEDLSHDAPPTTRVRVRTVQQAHADLGDELVLWLAAVDALDTTPALLPARLDRPRATLVAQREQPTAHLGLASLLVMLAMLLLGTWLISRSEWSTWPAIPLVLSGAGWSAQRLYWAQHLRRRTSPTRHWPLSDVEPGAEPRWTGLGFDAAFAVSGLVMTQGLEPLPMVGWLAVVGAPVMTVLSALTVWRAQKDDAPR